MPLGGNIGFYCRHLYEEKDLGSSETKLRQAKPATLATLNLKNEDAVIAVAAANLGLAVKCLRIMHHDCGWGEDSFVLKKMPGKGTKGFGRVRTVDGGFRTKTVTPDDIHDYASCELSEEGVEFIGSYASNSKTWCSAMFGEYFGNEASESTFYTKAAIVVAIPPARARTHLTIKLGAQLTPTALHGSPQQPTAGKPSGSAGKRKAGDADEVDEAGSASTQKKHKVSAPAPLQFPTGAGKKSTPVDQHRTVHVTNGQGGQKCNQLGGNVTLELGPGDGLRELKKLIREAFGKAKYQKLGKLQLVDGREAKTSDLVDDVTVCCTYSFAAGNLGNLYRGRRSFGGGGGGFFF
jgi:hypothetical protein